LVISTNSSATVVFSCRQAGRPKSAASRTLCTRGKAPKNGTSLSFAKYSAELPDNKYFIFGERGAEYLAKDKEVPFLGALPLVQSVREAADFGRPACLQENTTVADEFVEITKNLVSQVVFRNKNLPPTKAVEITNLVGCEAIKS
jgi:hypothetical protein